MNQLINPQFILDQEGLRATKNWGGMEIHYRRTEGDVRVLPLPGAPPTLQVRVCIGNDSKEFFVGEGLYGKLVDIWESLRPDLQVINSYEVDA
jgi:hypothetical protein